MNLIGSNACCFDLEIKHTIDGQKITWNDHHLMGISVGCLFDFKTLDYKFYMDDNLEEMVKRLNDAEIVTGFNIIAFDNKLLNASCQEQLRPDLNFYDLLVESRAARKVDQYQKGMRLENHLQGTFGEGKSGDGADAPRLWQERRLGELMTYITRDVKCEAKLFKHVWEGKPVTVTGADSSWTLRSPWRK